MAIVEWNCEFYLVGFGLLNEIKIGINLERASKSFKKK